MNGEDVEQNQKLKKERIVLCEISKEAFEHRLQKQIDGIEMLHKALPSIEKEIVEILDILLRWFVLRFCESNTTCLLKGNGHRVMTVSPHYDQYKDAWDTHVLLQIKIGDRIETVRFFHCYKHGVDRVFVDHPMFLEKVWGKTGSKIYGPKTRGLPGQPNSIQYIVPTNYDGNRFITIQDGVWKATPLLLTVAVIELSDIAFAVDSIPAVFGVTQDPSVVFTSNFFAILDNSWSSFF
ncbi:hypothetical protein LOK49_LG13G01640 [Camellia lanceoleosa]|uniref:Uncharacterized protein n=1 Tax=Camellia lanceoleosa TaxID=1840588 RepID=A0ACC0FL16_9ERIC|nr:hypothetical protein LOK49_LG13G01640 [Camellia lanceoleosa]